MTRITPLYGRLQDYGADGTGLNDSSPAFRAAIAALGANCVLQPSETPNHIYSRTSSTHHPRRSHGASAAASGAVVEGDNGENAHEPPTVARRDCGGAVLDLSGGTFNLSEPVVIPAGWGNYAVQRGSLFAGDGFMPRYTPPSRSTGDFSPVTAPKSWDDPAATSFLLILGGTNCTPSPNVKGACAFDVSATELELDARHVAGGCLLVAHTQFATVGPGLAVLGFGNVGVTAWGSGGTVIQGVFAGE